MFNFSRKPLRSFTAIPNSNHQAPIRRRMQPHLLRSTSVGLLLMLKSSPNPSEGGKLGIDIVIEFVIVIIFVFDIAIDIVFDIADEK
jgi:hypothetical protein